MLPSFSKLKAKVKTSQTISVSRMCVVFSSHYIIFYCKLWLLKNKFAVQQITKNCLHWQTEAEWTWNFIIVNAWKGYICLIYHIPVLTLVHDLVSLSSLVLVLGIGQNFHNWLLENHNQLIIYCTITFLNYTNHLYDSFNSWVLINKTNCIIFMYIFVVY